MSLIRKSRTYNLNNLPRLKSRSIKTKSGKRIYTGSILRRRIQGPLKIYWHYAFIYGRSVDYKILLIENNRDGVECIEWKDFLADETKWELYHTESTSTNFDKIMRRAKKRAEHFYNSSDNNCEHFINYCLFSKLESVQVDNTKIGADIAISYFEGRLINTDGPAAEAALRIIGRLRDTHRIKRNVSQFDDLINERLKNSRTK